jgi:hypothetical protein
MASNAKVVSTKLIADHLLLLMFPYSNKETGRNTVESRAYEKHFGGFPQGMLGGWHTCELS